MAVTIPDNYRTPDSGDQYALVQDLGVLADSIQAGTIKRANLYVGTAAQRTAFTTAVNGVNWQDTDGTASRYVRVAGVWVMQGDRFYSGTAAQRVAFTTAPAGSQWQDTDGTQTTYARIGGAWVLTGGADTGWVTVTSFGSGWSADPTYAPQLRRVGNVVYGRGRIIGPATSGTVFTAPVGFRPTLLSFFILERGSSAAAARITMDTTGVASLTATTATAGSAVSLNQLIYPLG